MKKIVSMFLTVVMVMCMVSVAVAEDAIKIGVIGPVTGAAANYGISVKQGCELAASELNALGGVQLEILVEDDEHDAEKAINAYNAVMDKGAQLIVGTVTTAPCIAVGAQAYEERVFMLTPSASSLDVIANKDNVFQLCFTDPGMGASSAQYISDEKLSTKIAVIYNNADTYSTGIYQAFEAKANELGLNVVCVETFAEGATDFSVQVTKAKESEADLLFLPIYYQPASMILQQAATIGYAPTIVGCDGMDGILNIENFDTSLAEGVTLLTPYSSAATDEKTSNFVKNYEAAYGATPDQFAADAYDCIYAVYEMINATGMTADTDPEEACEMLIAAIQELEFTGTTGTMTWSETGEVNKTPVVVKIENGAYVGA